MLHALEMESTACLMNIMLFIYGRCVWPSIDPSSLVSVLMMHTTSYGSDLNFHCRSSSTLFLLVFNAFHIVLWYFAHINYPVEDVIAVVPLHNNLFAATRRLCNAASCGEFLPKCRSLSQRPQEIVMSDKSGRFNTVLRGMVHSKSRLVHHTHPNSLATFFKSIPCASNPLTAVTYFRLFLSTLLI